MSRKEARAQKLGFVSTTLRLPEDVSEESLLEQIDALNANDFVHGILIQLAFAKAHE